MSVLLQYKATWRKPQEELEVTVPIWVLWISQGSFPERCSSSSAPELLSLLPAKEYTWASTTRPLKRKSFLNLKMQIYEQVSDLIMSIIWRQASWKTRFVLKKTQNRHFVATYIQNLTHQRKNTFVASLQEVISMRLVKCTAVREVHGFDYGDA